jgi:2-C-methyl-D-erythritol 4-phosphate cytidylyltransferase
VAVVGGAAPDAGAGRVTGILDRSRLRNIQTPQGFRLTTIREAYRLMDADPDRPTNPTDDCGVVLRDRPDVPVVLVEGSMRNLKVTHPDDLLVAERLLATRRAPAAEATAPE